MTRDSKNRFVFSEEDLPPMAKTAIARVVPGENGKPDTLENVAFFSEEGYRRLQDLAQQKDVSISRLLDEAVEAVLENKVKKHPGPAKGTTRKQKKGGDWTPLVLKVEMRRLRISTAKLGKALGISHVAVARWLHTAIPDARQESISRAMAAFEKEKSPES